MAQDKIAQAVDSYLQECPTFRWSVYGTTDQGERIPLGHVCAERVGDAEAIAAGVWPNHDPHIVSGVRVGRDSVMDD